ncbi:ribosomal large subunit pseudouridine synthase C [Sulfuricella sp. T08]|uniref:RluA family pseudouridine synthase n=1 Tax=Sulfuricella sp. T08 TaxID=1632857 RepID=UPI000617A05D|nr:RluA family pseudouridine synthase [Sulfuricella sp. T08]GAO37249.1 ribosomal large subunit pseudouridine synthase C [Sulfuricella sp. T08]
MNDLSKESVTWVTIDESSESQRIDNFLFKHLKGVPKSHVYRILRSGEVRVNSKRVDATCRLVLGDVLRIPPVRSSRPTDNGEPKAAAPQMLSRHILYQDDALLALNKPSGMAVHGGSGISRGVIEQMRLEHPEFKFLELVHRLDRETSGVLLLAKKRSALVELHRAMREGETEKRYLTLVKGQWQNAKQSVKLPLHKYVTGSGERRVSVNEEGQSAHTIFTLKKSWPEFCLLEAELKTGRTHQIRVHLSHLGFPIAGDDKYGDFPLNKALQKRGLKRMFLHAFKMVIKHPLTGELLSLEAPLPEDLERFLRHLDTEL